jgi:hypothetical protein
MEFDPFDLSVKDLTTRNVIARSNSTGPLYTLHLPSSTASNRTSPCAMSTIAAPRILATVATSTWHRRLGHPGLDALSSLSRSSFIFCTSTNDFIMLVSWANTPDCHFPVHRVVRKKPLIYYILIFGHLRLLVCLVQNTTWPFLMISLIICGLFRLNRNLTPSPPCPIFFAYVATQFSCTVKAMQCDKGREFDNSSTRTFLLSKGAQLQMSCPYTPPQNGKVERIIRTINNVIRTLLIQASFPRRYWAEGLHTAVYLLNRLLTKTISAVCPHVALFGSTPSYEHLRVFGCACYPNIAVTAPYKLAPRSTRCDFLGYSTDHKGYRCLDLSTNHLIISRHVVFDEESFPLAALPNLTDLDFLCKSGSPVSTIRTPISLAGSSTAPACQPAPIVPSGFEPHVAPMDVPLPAPQVPLSFPPRAAPAPSAARITATGGPTGCQGGQTAPYTEAGYQTAPI